MKLLLYVTVCFTAVCAGDNWDFIAEPDEALFISDQSEVSINEHRSEDPAVVEQNSARGNEVQDSTDEDYEDYTDDVDEQTGDMAEILGRARRCRKRLGGRCQNANKYPSCKKGYKASPKGRPYCTSKHRMCCYPDKRTTTPAPKGCTPSSGEFKIGDQCYRINLKRGNWTNARANCTGMGLDLAQPKDPWAVYEYLKTKGWTSTRTWIGARGSGSCYQWFNGTCIPQNSPWWVWGPDGDNSTSWAVNIYNSPSTKPKILDAHSISYTHFQSLCERK